jgi:hypothetical protein
MSGRSRDCNKDSGCYIAWIYFTLIRRSFSCVYVLFNSCKFKFAVAVLNGWKCLYIILNIIFSNTVLAIFITYFTIEAAGSIGQIVFHWLIVWPKP